MKKFFKVGGGGGGGGGGVQQPPRSEKEGVVAKINKFRNFHFLLLSFCHNNDYVPEILETQSRFGQVFYF